MSEAEIDRLLGGQPADRRKMLADALAELRVEFGSDEPPPVGPALSEFVDMRLLVDKGDLPVTAASNAHGPVLQVAGLPKRRATSNRRSNRMLESLTAFLGTLAGKMVVGAVVASAATGGAHAVGVIEIPILPPVERHIEQSASPQLDEDVSNSRETLLAETTQVDAEDPDADLPIDEVGNETTDDDPAWEAHAKRCEEQAELIEASAGYGDDAAEEAASLAADQFEEECLASFVGGTEVDVTVEDDEDAWEEGWEAHEEYCDEQADLIEASAGYGDDAAEEAASLAADQFEEECLASFDDDEPVPTRPEDDDDEVEVDIDEEAEDEDWGADVDGDFEDEAGDEAEVDGAADHDDEEVEVDKAEDHDGEEAEDEADEGDEEDD